jgi:hypothetical protein
VSLFEDFQKWILSFARFGYVHSLSGIEEQAFAEFFASRGCIWHHISPEYQAIPWKPEWVSPLKIEHCPILHYLHEPPFMQKEYWPDTALWWSHDILSLDSTSYSKC